MKSICLQDWEIRALQEGRKTQFRVLVKPQPIIGQYQTTAAGRMMNTYQWQSVVVDYCPFGRPGDKVFVKESHIIYAEAYETSTGNLGISKNNVLYKADGRQGLNWHSPVTMPQWASRFTLLIKSVRVERVNEISEEDAYAEGIDDNNEDYQKAEHFQQGGSPIETGSPATFAFKGLWDKLYPGSWQRGDWVWVISFKRG